MDDQAHPCPEFTASDSKLLQRVERGSTLTADISRADLLICRRLANDRTVVVFHAMPQSIPSLYRQNQTGRTFTAEEQPLVLSALASGSGGRRQREVLQNGAPVFQDVFPIHNGDNRVIAAMVVETSMIAHERQRRRNHHFRRAVLWLQEMTVRGELDCAGVPGRFGQYDGIYLVDRNRTIRYMSGIASNLFRTIGLVIDAVGEQVSILEEADVTLVEEAFATRCCKTVRHESPDGRVWVRSVVPVRAPATGWLQRWFAQPWYGAPRSSRSDAIDVVFIMVHNATEAVQKQRELNVKSAIIQEVHHRVKNNLQNIAAILRMQARRSQNDNERQNLLDAVNRVLSMSVIHEFLSHDEHRPINLRDLCHRIATQVVQVSSTADKDVQVQVHGPSIRLPASQATPAAMVVNELMLNAVEHGLAGRDHGVIDIYLGDLGDAVELVIADDGNGLPQEFSPAHSTSLGLQIVQTLVTDDLKGSLRLEANEDGKALPLHDVNPATKTGTRAVVTFPKRPLGVD